jgi:hypothetical protein
MGLDTVWLLLVQAKMERADALAEERTALTNYMRNTLITNELKFKEVRQLSKWMASKPLSMSHLVRLDQAVSWQQHLAGAQTPCKP